MTGPFLRAEEGQAIVIVGLAMVVLMGALALTVDWGYGFVARRAAQNEADAAALAAGNTLASAFVDSGQRFAVSQEQVWAAACAAETKKTITTTAQTHSLGVWFSSDPPTTPFTDVSPTTWSGLTASVINASGINDCSQGPTSVTAIGSTTVVVRVTSSATYTSLFGATTGQQLAVAASARVRLVAGAAARPLQLLTNPQPGIGLSGATTPPNAAIWPMMLHYNANNLVGPCGPYCADSNGSRLVQFWPATDNQNFGGFQGLVSFAHVSLRDGRDQLITEPDYRGTNNQELEQGHNGFTAPLPDTSLRSACGPTGWLTQGAPDESSSAQCDLPNWFYYGFGGSVGLDTKWSDSSWDAVAPSVLPASRSSCTNAAVYFPRPSCTDASPGAALGDWIETINAPISPDLASNMQKRMLDFIDRYGHVVEGARPALGKAAVVNVFVWDCAETYDPSGGRWTLIQPPTASCADIRGSDEGVYSGPRVDRVHVFTVVPFTFYAGLIQGGSVKAYWGDAFSQPGFYRTTGGSYASCATNPSPADCHLNPLVNSAFLVPDE